MSVLIRIDQSSRSPIYAQVAASVRRAMADGDLRAGDRLAPARDVADGLGINLHTVLRGYQELRDEGLIELRRGRGAVITAHGQRNASAYAACSAYVAAARRAGLDVDEAVALVRKGMPS